MDRSSSFTNRNPIDQVSFQLNSVEETVLEKILLAAKNHSALSTKIIADQVPYPSESVGAAIDKLLSMGLIQVTISDEFMD
ncbi:MAG: hypothetical protein AAF889_02490 [Cyanobacteria bacterium P01_D01_bin.73]